MKTIHTNQTTDMKANDTTIHTETITTDIVTGQPCLTNAHDFAKLGIDVSKLTCIKCQHCGTYVMAEGVPTGLFKSKIKITCTSCGKDSVSKKSKGNNFGNLGNVDGFIIK